MRIGDLARRVGLNTSAIRYYEELGLVSPTGRVAGRRIYAPDAVDRLQFVRAAQSAGFRLEEIRTVLAALQEPAAATAWRELARDKLGELDRELAQLKAARAPVAGALDTSCAGVARDGKLIAHESARRKKPRPRCGTGQRNRGFDS